MTRTDELTDYFRGMARHSRADVEDAAAFPAWAELAQRVLDQRRERLLQQLPETTLIAIAAGQISPNTAAQAALTPA